jgi:hypothetical protein
LRVDFLKNKSQKTENKQRISCTDAGELKRRFKMCSNVQRNGTNPLAKPTCPPRNSLIPRTPPTQNLKQSGEKPRRNPTKLPISLLLVLSDTGASTSSPIPPPFRAVSSPLPFPRGLLAAHPPAISCPSPDGRRPRARRGRPAALVPRPARPRVPHSRLRPGVALPVLVPPPHRGFTPSGRARSPGSRRGRPRAPWSSRRRRPRGGGGTRQSTLSPRSLRLLLCLSI